MRVFLNKPAASLWLKQGLKILVSTTLIYYCLTLVDVKNVVMLIKDVNVLYLFISFIFIVLGTVVVKSLITWFLLSRKSTTSYIELIKINFSLRFYTMILPKAVVAGIRWDKYRRISEPKYSFVLLAFEALTALTISALATLIFVLISFGDPIPLNIMLFSLSACSIFVFFMAVLFLYPDSAFMRYLAHVLNHFSLTKFLGGLVEKWKISSKLLNMEESRNFWFVFVVGLASHMLFLLGAYCLFLAMGIDINFTAVAWIRSAVFIFVSIPISLAGIGIREVGFIALFGLYGLESDAILAYAMLALLIQFGIAFVGVFTEIDYWLNN